MTLPAATAADRASALFAEHSAAVLRFARRRDPQLAEDVVSEVFAVAVRRIDDIPEGRELPWLYVVADHVLRNQQRSRARAARIPDALRPFTPGRADAPETPIIGDALGDLPDRERILLTMTAFEGLSAQEAADRMGIPYGSARNALSSGRKRLAAGLAGLSAAALLLLLVAGAVQLATNAKARSVERLAQAIQGAAEVHDVAIVRHGTTPTPRGTRYERWTDPSSGRTRLRLPWGDELIATGGDSLTRAARSTTRAKDRAPAPARSRQTLHDDLAVLDATRPEALRALLADETVQHTAVDGPRLGPVETTQLRGTLTGTDGERFDADVLVARDGRSVLRVAARPQDGTADSVVDFVDWTARPRAPAQSAPNAGAGGPVPADAAPTSVDQAAASPSTPPATPRAPSPEDRRGVAEQQRAATGAARSIRDATGSAPRRSRTANGPTPRVLARGGAAPMVHVIHAVTTCTGDHCRPAQHAEAWVELSGQRRSLVTLRKGPREPVFLTEWGTPARRSLLGWSRDRERTYGSRNLPTTPRSTGEYVSPAPWKTRWLAELSPLVANIALGGAEWDSLTPADPIDGRPMRRKTLRMPDPDAAVGWNATLDFDAVTRAPIAMDFRLNLPPGDQHQVERFELEISSWERLAAGYDDRVLTAEFPAGTRFSS